MGGGVVQSLETIIATMIPVAFRMILDSQYSKDCGYGKLFAARLLSNLKQPVFLVPRLPCKCTELKYLLKKLCY